MRLWNGCARGFWEDPMPDKKRMVPCDVLVVGGGIAGTAAAISAARAGAQVVLVEKNGYFGGTIVGAMHQALCGFYGLKKPSASTRTIHGGFADEFCAALKGAAVLQMGRVFVLSAGYKNTAAVLAEFIRSEKRIRFIRGTVFNAECRNHVVDSFRIRTAKKNYQICSQAVVDASGNNAVMRCMGMDGIYERDESRQLGGFSVRLSGIARGHEMLEIKVPYWLSKVQSEKNLPSYCRFTQFLPGPRPREGFLKICVADKESPQFARLLVMVLHRYLREVLPEMSASRISGFSERVFPRQDERSRGAYILTGEDVVSGRRFMDAAARGAWPSEFWDKDNGPQYRYVENGHYEIPKRCLQSRRFENLFAAGTMISADPSAHASARVSGIALATGEAAGRLAAAYCSDKK